MTLLVERGSDGFALSDVAQAAGVSERTLYRYYANREELVRSIVREDVARVDEEIARKVGDRMDLGNADLLAETFAVFAEHADLIAAARILRTMGADEAASSSRTDALRAELAGRVNPAALDQLVGLIRVLSGSDAWMRMRESDIGLDSRAAGRAAQWAVAVLLQAAERGDGPLEPERD